MLQSADTEVEGGRATHRRALGATTPPVIECHFNTPRLSLLKFHDTFFNMFTEVSLPVQEPKMSSADGTQLPRVASPPASAIVC